MGELKRMTQFKDKAGEQDSVSAGLFTYPVLMAADILLYNTTHVPVGDDQKQHVEIARNIAERFNKKYGEIFVVPEPLIRKTSARIMGLDDPRKKMSKSAESSNNYINILDDKETIKQKIMRAVTDSGDEIKSGDGKPAITNLLNIFHEVSGKPIDEIEKNFEGRGYKEFKEALSDAVIGYLSPIQEKYSKLIADPDKIVEILNSGAEKVKPIAAKTLSDAKRAVGLGI
jgi:tryptophanyl-tRNA synthetase